MQLAADGEVNRMLRSSRRLLSLGCILLLGCSSGPVRYVSPYPTPWVKQQIAAYEASTLQNSSRVRQSVTYEGKRAYLIPSPCCDQYDYLYDASGVILCAPSGGFTGGGDGSCPDVLATAAERRAGDSAAP